MHYGCRVGSSRRVVRSGSGVEFINELGSVSQENAKMLNREKKRPQRGGGRYDTKVWGGVVCAKVFGVSSQGCCGQGDVFVVVCLVLSWASDLTTKVRGGKESGPVEPMLVVLMIFK